MSGLDQEILRHALKTAKDNGYRYLKVTSGQERFEAVFAERDSSEDAETESSELEAMEVASAPLDHPLPAPVVGYFRDSTNLLVTGAMFEKGDRVGEIVALGLANDVWAPISGEIAEVSVEPGQAVEFGQVLAIMREK